MKKILILVLVLIIVAGCTKSPEKQLAELGYSENEIEKIFTLTEENQLRFFDEYQDRLIELIFNSNFIEDNLDKYLHFYEKLDEDMLFDLVNRDIVTDANLNKLKEMYASPYYVKKNEALYLEKLDSYKSVREMMEIINTRRYMPLYENVETCDTGKDILLLVNKYYQLPSDYEPEDLVEVEGRNGIVYLRKEVAEAYARLLQDATENDYPLIIASAYRSYAYQEGLYDKYLANDPVEVVDTYSARPGHSEHQSGLCIDVTVPGYSIDDFYMTEASTWLAENCDKYGFIIRYETGKEDITGYQAEPWQIRYVGLKAAKEIKEMGITFDEYWECFVNN